MTSSINIQNREDILNLINQSNQFDAPIVCSTTREFDEISYCIRDFSAHTPSRILSEEAYISIVKHNRRKPNPDTPMIKFLRGYLHANTVYLKDSRENTYILVSL